MNLQEKLTILSTAAKYDVSCSSSGSSRKNVPGGIGNGAISGICHSWSDDGRCISLLKILFTNFCVYDCAYCENRTSNDIPRAAFTPEEVAELTINFYRRNYIEGLFLSSGIIKNPNYTMELLVKAVKKLRNFYQFNGYIHLKAIPGADSRLIIEAGQLVDRMSVNIELPSSTGLKLLAPQKKKEDIVKPMGLIGSQILQVKEERQKYMKTPSFVPAGQSTQLIVGATQDSDKKIIKLSEGLYHGFSMKRVYYSAYVPVANSPKLNQVVAPPLTREHRLYQADWLLRFYGFNADELLKDNNPYFDLELDPKSQWALQNLQHYPIEVNRADYNKLLRVPGIGVKSARRILMARKMAALDFADLKKFGVVMKRARFFITCNGKYHGEKSFKEEVIRQSLLPSSITSTQKESWEQLSLWPELPAILQQ
ncbi:MAG: putative DNA modification/repair radical SAM protein [Bacillota bacterium]|nr:putative DNA modification/repair radical SAM protein [Bacillota bacterium]